MTKFVRKHAFAATFIVLALLALFFAAPLSASADEEATQEDIESGNVVNPQQRPDSSFIYETSIDELAVADSYMDGQSVQVKGEVVGDNIKGNVSGDKRWITLCSEGGANVVSVYMSDIQAESIDTFGRYGVEGTQLQVSGQFNLTCKMHEGMSDLHADVVTVVSPGHENEDEIDLQLIAPGVLMVLVGVALTLIYYILRERQR